MKKARDSEATLFSHALDKGQLGAGLAPLADRMRPRALSEVRGQQHLLGPQGPLRRAIEDDRLVSMILWGDPGCGKTTLAHVISQATKAHFEPFSAVLGGVAELRQMIARAKERRTLEGKRTVLFVDEIHRFNRAQQDAFLPHVENGTVILVGATTENPSFAVNAAVLSRAKVFRLQPLRAPELVAVLQRALSDEQRGLGKYQLSAETELLEALAAEADGDARRALTQLEALAELVRPARNATAPGPLLLKLSHLQQLGAERVLLYDKKGEEHYNVVSAMIKSLRGSDPDASVYWMMRMVEAGDDPRFILRRLLIFASEDVGNADPRALQVAVNADAAFQRLGMPEGLYAMAQACLYLASCPKSNAANVAWHAAQKAVHQFGALPVPKKLRNAPTKLMKAEGYGDGYKYPHDFAGNHVAGESYLPEELSGARYYEPSSEGLEEAIGRRLLRLREGQGR